MDMWATALAGFIGGPWFGASVGLLTNLFGAQYLGPQYLPFGIVNAFSGLVWGYFGTGTKTGRGIIGGRSTQMYRDGAIFTLGLGVATGFLSTVLVSLILSTRDGWVAMPSGERAEHEHPAVLISRIFFEYFSSNEAVRAALVDAHQMRMNVILALPMHLFVTVPDKIFGTSLAFFALIGVIRRVPKVITRRGAYRFESSPIVTLFLTFASYSATTQFTYTKNLIPSNNYQVEWALLFLITLWFSSIYTYDIWRKDREQDLKGDWNGAYTAAAIERAQKLHEDLFDLYTVLYATMLFSVFRYFTNDTVVEAIRKAFENGIGALALLLAMKVVPAFASGLLRPREPSIANADKEEC
jgi:hypothetical protein